MYDDPERKLPYITDTKTLHHYDMTLNPTEAFAESGEIFDLDEPFERANFDSHNALRMATNGIDEIVLVPRVYSGYAYRYSHEGDSWTMEKLEGGPVPRDSLHVSEAHEELKANPELRRSSIFISGPFGRHRARIFNWCLGVVILGSGEIVNFTMQTPLRGRSWPSRLSLAIGLSCSILVVHFSGYGPLRFDDQRLNRSHGDHERN